MKIELTKGLHITATDRRMIKAAIESGREDGSVKSPRKHLTFIRSGNTLNCTLHEREWSDSAQAVVNRSRDIQVKIKD